MGGLQRKIQFNPIAHRIPEENLPMCRAWHGVRAKCDAQVMQVSAGSIIVAACESDVVNAADLLADLLSFSGGHHVQHRMAACVQPVACEPEGRTFAFDQSHDVDIEIAHLIKQVDRNANIEVM